MGFRNDAYAKLWKLDMSRKYPEGQISISRKDKTTGEYVTDFQGFVTFNGKAAEDIQKVPKEGRFQIKQCDVSRVFNKEKQREYTNFRVFEIDANVDNGGQRQQTSGRAPATAKGDDNMSVAELEARLAEAKLRESGKNVAGDPDELPFE